MIEETKPKVAEASATAVKTEFVTFLGAYPPDKPFDKAAAAVAGQSRELLVTNGHVVEWWNLETGERSRSVSLEPAVEVSPIAPASASPRGELFAFGTPDGYVLMRAGESQPMLNLTELTGLSNYDVTGTQFSPDGRWAFVESEETPQISVVDLERSSVVHTLSRGGLSKVGAKRAVLGGDKTNPPAFLQYGDWQVVPLEPAPNNRMVITDFNAPATVVAVGLDAQKARWHILVYDAQTGRSMLEHSMQMSEEETTRAEDIERENLREHIDARLEGELLRIETSAVSVCFDTSSWKKLDCTPPRRAQATEALPLGRALHMSQFDEFSVFSTYAANFKSLPIFSAVFDGREPTVIDLTKGKSPLSSAAASDDGRYIATVRQNLSVAVWDTLEGKQIDQFDLRTTGEISWAEQIANNSGKPPRVAFDGASLLVSTWLWEAEGLEEEGFVVYERKFHEQTGAETVRRGLRHYPERKDTTISPLKAYGVRPPKAIWAYETQDAASELLVQNFTSDTTRKTKTDWGVDSVWIDGGWVHWTASPYQVSAAVTVGDIAQGEAPLLNGWNPETGAKWTLRMGETPEHSSVDKVSPDGRIATLEPDRKADGEPHVSVLDRSTGKITQLLSSEEGLGRYSYPMTHITADWIIVGFADELSNHERSFAVFESNPPFKKIGKCRAGGVVGDKRATWTADGHMISTVESHLVWRADLPACARANGELTLPSDKGQ